MTPQDRFSKTLHWVLTTIIAVYIAILSFTYFDQDNLIYPGTIFKQSDKYDETKFVPWLNDWFQPIGFKSTVKDSKEIWLCFHGNGERAEITLDYFTRLRSVIQDAKIDIYVMEYPGFGLRPGRLSEKSLVTAGTEAIDLLAQEPKRLYVLGQSLGSGVGTLAVAQKKHKVSGYVMLTPFTSMQAAARNRFYQHLNIFSYLFPVEWLVRDHYRSIEQISSIPCPISILANKDDKTTPLWMAQKLQKISPATMLQVFPGNHYIPLEGDAETISAFNYARGKP